MLNLNPTTLAAVVDQARTSAAEHPRWLHAIDRAVVELLDNPYIERGELHGIVVMSSTSANLYSANGTCTCEAYKFGQPCWHRAAARLVKLHNEKIEADAPPAVSAFADFAARLAAARAAADALNECYS
jgi:hypothetical protein